MSTKIDLLTENDYQYFYAEITENTGYHISANVFEVMSWEMDNTPADTELYLTISIKWDGCSHVDFKTDECMKHLCGKVYFERHSKLMISIYEKLTALMQHYDKSVAE